LPLGPGGKVSCGFRRNRWFVMRASLRFGLSLTFVCSVLAASAVAARAEAPLLLRDPTISRSHIAFAYGGDIWITGRDGGEAHRLATGFGLESGPVFSPDGTQVAFTGVYDSNVDVYVVPSAGGEPRRLTYHPAADVAVGWTPDGKDVLFRSNRNSSNDPNELYTVPATGGFATRLSLGMAETGSFSPDATHLAYVPNFRWEPFWQGYRGGQTTPVYIADLADSSVVRVPRNDSNDDDPMWVGDTVYFLSDRDGPVTLFAYDTHSRRVSRLLPSSGFDITSASASADAIVYAKFDSLHVYDVRTHESHEVHVSLAADMPQLRPHWEKVGTQIQNAALSPTGQRAVFEAHGEILTVPAEHGDARNVSNSPAVEDRDPAWSPDGKWIAWFSDKSGNYQLFIRDQKGLEPPRAIDLGAPSFFYSPTWSPDSKKIAYTDKRLNLWYLDIEHPTPVKVATAAYEGFGQSDFSPAWSPDSRWLTYTDVLPNYLHAVEVYSLEEHRSRQVTDGLSDARFPQFDVNGKYLYFTASTNTGLTSQGLDMTSDEHPVSSNVYCAVLQKDVPSPVAPKSDDESEKKPPEPGAKPPEPGAKPPEPGAKPAAAAKEPKVAIDFAGIGQRIIALPIPNANYVGLSAGKTGQLFLAVTPLVTNEEGPPAFSVVAFDLAAREVKPFVAGVNAFVVSANGEKALYGQRGRFFIVDTARPPAPGAGALDTASLEVYVEPRAQWEQMYHEVWRIERDFFYDPHYHGLDIAAAERRFEPYVAGIAARDDLTFLFREMLSYMSVGHMFVYGGSEPPMPHVNVGLLGADYRIENGRYRFAKIYDGENWNPGLEAPLTQPGTNVKAGEYLLAVNDRSVSAERDVYSYFEETAGKQITLTVGPNPDGSGSRKVTVVPVPSEFPLRNLDWIESNRREVDRASGGKLAYVYLPDTAYGGFTNFNRYFFAQVGKEGVILDERFNHGGQIADYIIDYLKRKPMSIIKTREGKTVIDPPLAIFGPKVMIINQFAGSGGDALPWYFRKSALGPLVGERTWGGLVGIGGYPPLMDGGGVTAPRAAIGGLHGQWEVEGHGIAPDVEVWQDPKLLREGHDPQLEAAIAKALQLLREHPLPVYHAPPFPDHHPVLPGPGT
jgi:tricorn protease